MQQLLQGALPNNAPTKPRMLTVHSPELRTQLSRRPFTGTGAEFLIWKETFLCTASVWVNDYKVQLSHRRQEPSSIIASTGLNHP